MIAGVGIDVVNMAHFKRVMGRGGITFIKKTFCPEEQVAARKFRSEKRLAFYAKRYAAKEAFVKAIGTGFGPIGLQDIWVENDPSGQPRLMLSEKAQKFMKKTYKRPMHIHLSLSDDGVAAAIVVLDRV